MSPIETLLAKLPGVRKAGNGWSARCPAHEDQRASLSVSEGDDGTALVKCHAGCDTSAILAAVGLKLADLFPTRASPTPIRNGKPKASGRTFPTAKDAVAELERRHGTHSALWTYHDAVGNSVGQVVRWDRPDGKDIRPVARHDDGWRIGAMPEPRPLYGLPELTTARRIVVTEGEKAADAARSIGFTATTSVGGSQAADKSDWRPLDGKEVWILPDNDPAGRKYAATVADVLAKVTSVPVVRVVELPDLPAGGDIVDWIDAHGEAAEADGLRMEIEALAQTVEPLRPEDADDLAYRSFPVDALPEPIRGFVDAGARAIGCDPSYLALPLLTAIAAAVGNTRRLELKPGWSVPPILWGAIVGESGTAKTPAFKLQRALGSEHRESGLAARLLLTCPPRKPKRWTEADIDPGAEAELTRLVDRLYELQPAVSDEGDARPVTVRLTPEAKAVWKAYYNAHAVEQADLTGDMAAAWSKLEEYAARLALVIHFARWAAGDATDVLRLDAVSMEAGITLAMWFKHEARRVYAMLDETDADRNLRRLVEWIERKGGSVTAREVQQGCRWLKQPGVAEAALDGLVKAGRGSWVQSPTSQRGQPTRRFALSTASTVYGNAPSPEGNSNTVDVDNVDTPEHTPPACDSLFAGTTPTGPTMHDFDESNHTGQNVQHCIR